MKDMPEIIDLGKEGKYYTHCFESFKIKVYVPKCDLPVDIINYGFMTPYLLVFEETFGSIEDNIKFSNESGLSTIARRYGGSIVFVYPTSENGWDDASSNLFVDLIGETRISQYYENGVAIMRDRFTGKWEDKYIRGALHRSCLYGFGKSADYIAKNCLKTVIGNGLYGKGDITPAVCILQNLSVVPMPERSDLPIVSIGNSEEINDALMFSVNDLLIKEAPDYVDDFDTFVKKYRRMVGNINIEEDFNEMNMIVEPGYVNVKVAKDNCGDDKDLEVHNIGYVAYYNKGIMDDKKVPLVMCFHGGGDSAMCMVALTDWHLVVSENNFLLVSVENHMNNSATEIMEVLEHLKNKYNIDESRIYSTGFSMGGAKSWDLYEQYPNVFAGIAPMDATFEIGRDVFGNYSDNINKSVLVPVFYVGGEDSPLPELPIHEKKCLDRLAYILKVNKCKKQNTKTFDNQTYWEDKFMALKGDEIITDYDENKDSTITMHKFYSTDGNCYTVFASASKQQHEMRHLNCKNAWKFISQFRRNTNGEICIDFLNQ